MKKRLDISVSEKKNISLKKAQALIMAGAVFVNGQKSDKSGFIVPENATIEIKEKSQYVSRGALKLKKAVEDFKIDLKDKIICDVGTSTGGFTDLSLQNGARKVYAIDTGYGQIDQKLREDRRVILMERTNIKKVDALPEKVDIFVIDVSFISLRQVLPAVKKIDKKASVIALIKPQFEVKKGVADKTKGIIKDKEIQLNIVNGIGKFAEDLGYKIEGLIESPITGAEGNKEFFIWLL
jgi:23S rRNA (cytidine1920-2'-O)/16S rRNA (cytidine1409-2'-O)-methyltransferase